MGATASINYAASKKYKPCEPIEVKFNKVVKYDDGDEKPFKDDFQLATKKQPLSLLATAIRILERRPKDELQPHANHLRNGYVPNNYAKQVRPRNAYVVMNKPTKSSSTLNSSLQSGSLSSEVPKTSQQKQLKTKQNLYMSLIHPTSVRDPRYGMTVPSRIRTPMDYHVPIRHQKANTLPRYSAADGKRLRVSQKLYMDMIRPVMASPQYLKLGASRSVPPLTHRSASKQTQLQQTRLTPRPPNDGQILRRLDPNLNNSHPKPPQGGPRREEYRRRREDYDPVNRPPAARHFRNDHASSSSNSSLPHRDRHLPRITRKTKDDVSLNSSLNSRSQIPRNHPDNIKPLYFRKSMAYERKDLLSTPLPSMNSY